MADQDEAKRRPGAPLVERIIGWSASHRWKAAGGWFLMVVAAIVLSGLVSVEPVDDYDPGESGRASRVLDEQGEDSRPREYVLIESPERDKRFTDDPALRKAAQDLVTALRGTGGAVVNLRSPLGEEGKQLISEDGRSALVTFDVAGPEKQESDHFDAAVAAVERAQDAHPQVRLAQAGDESLSEAQSDIYADDFKRSEILSLPLTLVILLVVFGALVAAGIPILLAVTAVASALSVLMMLEGWIPIGDNVAPLVLLFGMAVGVDYSLFYLRREREERFKGRGVDEALRITARTSGRAVVISGVTVVFCVAGLFMTGVDSFGGMAAGTILVVGLAVVGSLTVLPALLSLLGHRVDSIRVPWLGRRRTGAQDSRVWAAIARGVVRRPLLLGGTAAVLLMLAALPVFDMRLADPAPTDDLPRSNATVDAFARIQERFPGGPAPARVVVWGDRVDEPAVQQAVNGLHQQVGASGGLLGEPIQTTRVGEALVVKVPLAGTGADAKSNRALEYLRDRALPATLGEVSGIEYGVTGKTAGPYDLREALRNRTPLVFAFVLGLAFILLTMAFRSLLIPAISIVLNLLSIGAACGAVVWIFQYDHLGGVLGFTSYHGVMSWLPLFMFVVLFGLSMDYHIFILTRIRERWLGGASNRDAVVGGISASAGVVTSAAIIMVSVFTIFTTLSTISFKMLGVGLSVAVLIDATVVRGVLLPAAMSLAGERAWALPSWLSWLPRLGTHSEDEEAPGGGPVEARAGAGAGAGQAVSPSRTL